VNKKNKIVRQGLLSFFITLILTTTNFGLFAMEQETKVAPVTMISTEDSITYIKIFTIASKEYEVVCSMDKRGKFEGQKSCFSVEKNDGGCLLDNDWFDELKRSYEAQQLNQNIKK